MRELAEMVTKAQQGAIDTMSGRISQSLDEIKDMALKMKEAYAREKQPAVEEKRKRHPTAALSGMSRRR